MLLNRYNLDRAVGVNLDEDEPLLGDRINSRKASFKLNAGVARAGAYKKTYNSDRRHGNIFSGRGYPQRVVVKAHYKTHNSGSAGAGNLRGHLSYITRDGAGIDGEKPVLFGSFEDDLDRTEFYNLCKGDRHHFRLIISPENGHEVDNFKGYIEKVMDKMEKDLGTRLEWVSSIHHDTDHVHAHVVLRGKDDEGKDLVIAPNYISNGIRERASEIATRDIGERSLADIERGIEKEVRDMRVTSLDRFIEKRGVLIEGENGEVGEIRIKSRDIGRSGYGAFYQGMVKQRLSFLATTSMARQEAHGVYYVRANFMEELKEILQKHDIIKQLHRSMPEEARGAKLYKSDSEFSPIIRAEILKIANINELTDHKYMVINDASEELHYVPLALNKRTEHLREGDFVEVSAGKSSTAKADEAILEIASINDGKYSRDLHLSYVADNMKFIKDADKYVDYHGKRLGVLEAAQLVEKQEDGSYWVGDDVVVMGQELEQGRKYKKARYADVKSLSASPILDKNFIIYDGDQKDASKVQGRIEQIELVNAKGRGKYMLVRDGEEQAHYVPYIAGGYNKNLEVGCIVEVSAGKGNGGADYNINALAQENAGIYSRDAHMEFLGNSRQEIEDIDSYLDFHAKRLETLEKAEIVEAIEGGGYNVAEDVIERGAELNKKIAKKHNKKSLARIKQISPMPLEKQITAIARTWLDLEIYRYQKDYALSYTNADKGTLEAISKRQDWLLENGYARAKGKLGEFVMNRDALGRLKEAELEETKNRISNEHGRSFTDIDLSKQQLVQYVGYFDLHGGNYIVVEGEKDLSLLKSSVNTSKYHSSEFIRISDGKNGIEIERDIYASTKEQAIEKLIKDIGLEYKELDIKGEVTQEFIGAVHLDDGFYAIFNNENKFGLAKTELQPLYEKGKHLEISLGEDGYAEIKELNKQIDLDLPDVSKDIDIDDDWWD